MNAPTSTPKTLPSGELSKSFEPQQFESELYRFWESEGCFEASDENAPGQKAFCIMIPPPNVTGVLHMGHALGNTIQDTLIRWRRMKGDNTLWMPGTDHAGIATQNQVEKQIAKEGVGPTGRPLTRHDLGREKFLERTWKWKEEHHSGITSQLRRMGSSYDWRRERFTLDEGLSKAVREVFVSLYEKGLIYQGERIINWCPRCQTALSDLEVIPTDRKGHFYHLRYPIVEKDGSPVHSADGEPLVLTIATTRPETLLGDSAVAVHPDDERYLAAHGKFARLPLLGRIIPVITDPYVDREFGSGALKVTPAHDFNDAELGQKHGLEVIQCMGKDGFITAAGGPYQGLKYLGGKGGSTPSPAREKIVEDLKAQGILTRVEDHAMKVGLCERCDTVAEPLVSMQWWVKIAPLAQPAIEAVESGRIEFSPKNWEKTYFEWMRNIRDWCISRQLWWGHQIPAWHCGACAKPTVAREAPTACSHCGSRELKQDEDVLDTWFSSGLWPFTTLGWPEKTAALKTFYPTAILETGFDIIFFWVARMIMMGLHFMGDVPFRKVYLHALVRDEKGQKMSKSKGNVIDPLVLIEQHGADPLRFTLASMAGQGRDIKLSVDRVEGYRAFCNKLWNAVKFFHLQFEPESGGAVSEPEGGVEAWLLRHRAQLLPANQWVLSRLQTALGRIEAGLAGFELNESAQAIYEFVWHELCDWHIEFSKLPLKSAAKGPHGRTLREETLATLHYALEQILKAAHPIMPFVTEKLWQSLPWVHPANTPARKAAGRAPLRTLMLQPYPQAQGEFRNEEAERAIQGLRAVIEAVRNFRGENSVAPKTRLAVQAVPAHAEAQAFLERFREEIAQLANLEGIAFLTRAQADAPGQPVETVLPLAQPAAELRIPLKGLVNVEEEEKRVKKEIDRVRGDLSHVRSKLGKDTFLSKAPPELVAQERAREQEYLSKLQDLEGALSRLAALRG
jgi:valyl-tRNA synthetase